MRKVRAKFRCEKSDAKVGSPVRMRAVAADGVPENELFHRYTPDGTLFLTVDNPAVDGFFVEGAYYYLDLTPVDAAAPAGDFEG
jgi:hypothetical protein